jgi:protein Hikeshi
MAYISDAGAPRLSNEKPSAVFRLRGTFTQSSASSSAQVAFGANPVSADPSSDVTAILGLALEPLSSISQQLFSSPPQSTSSSVAKPSALSNPTLLAEKIVKHLFNYASGFVSDGSVTPQTMIPMNVIAKWYDNFMGKLRAGGTGFLENVE